MYEENRDYYQNGQNNQNDLNGQNSQNIQNAQDTQNSQNIQNAQNAQDVQNDHTTGYTPNWQPGGQTYRQQGSAGQQTGGWQNAAGQAQYYGTWQDDRQRAFQGNTNTWQDGRQQGNAWQNAGQTNAWQGADPYQSADQYQGAGKTSKKRARREKKKKTSSGFGAGKAVAIALCCSLLGGVIGAGGVIFGGPYLGLGSDAVTENGTVILQGERPVSPINVANIDTSKEMTEAEVYAMNVNSTVGITTSITTNYWGIQSTSAASGSGFILTEDGYIITNQHVIDSSDTITVTTFDGTAYDAELVGFDTSNDIAVLKIDAKGLTPVILGDSDTANVGDKVVAIGNPLGELTFSLVGGFISALNRSVTFSTGTTMDLMQVSCAINAGNSGGALFNMYGEVIGITNAKYSNNGNSSEASIENIGFAIPISHVRSIFESIITKGYITKPYIGVTITDVSSDLQSYGIPQGAMVKEVTEDGPADKAGLQPNDIVTQIDETKIDSSSALVDYVGKCSAGDKIILKVYRQGETVDISVTVEETRRSALEEEEQQNQQNHQQQQPGGEFSFPWDFFGF